jgi:hypothetical protein
VVVAGLEPTGSFDRGDPAVGPSNQTASGAGICLANYCAEIVNPEGIMNTGVPSGSLNGVVGEKNLNAQAACVCASVARSARFRARPDPSGILGESTLSG